MRYILSFTSFIINKGKILIKRSYYICNNYIFYYKFICYYKFNNIISIIVKEEGRKKELKSPFTLLNYLLLVCNMNFLEFEYDQIPLEK
jgi:hypothetical protein